MMAASSPSSGPALAEQYPRVLRFYARITTEKNKHKPEYIDDLWAFFQNCWHLKDWIMNDDAIPKVIADCPNPIHKKRKKRTFIKGSTECIDCEVNGRKYLHVCYDLATYIKHLIKKPSTLLGSIKVQIGDTFPSGPSTGSSSFDYEIWLDDKSRVNALAAAEQAIETWRDLFAKWGITAPSAG
jgi:hypothetical protein